MNDEEAEHPKRHLHRFVRMRVIHVCPVLTERELVHIRLARFDVGLIETAHTVHARGQQNPVPVNRGVLGQFVGDEQAQPITFNRFDGRAWG